MKKNAFYAQSGGVTSVINATAAAVIQEAKKFPNQINKVYAGQNGIIGALRENLIDTSKAVSYTHLRAHETCADLVCRLLLEKKKSFHPICAKTG